MPAEHNPKFPALPFHEDEALACSHGTQIRQFEFDLSVLIRILEKEDSLGISPATHRIIVQQMDRVVMAS